MNPLRTKILAGMAARLRQTLELPTGISFRDRCRNAPLKAMASRDCLPYRAADWMPSAPTPAQAKAIRREVDAMERDGLLVVTLTESNRAVEIEITAAGKAAMNL